MADHFKAPLAKKRKMATINEDSATATNGRNGDFPDAAPTAVVRVEDMDCSVENGESFKIIDNPNMSTHANGDRPMFQR